MSFPRYPEYKDSGTDWLGEVPDHWRISPLWTLFRRTKRTGFEEEQLLSVYRDHGVVPKASRDDNNNKASDDLSVYQLVEPGDLAINKMKAWQGAVAISDHKGIVSPAYFIYESTHSENSRFLHYLLRSPRYITGYLSLSKGIRVNQWDLEPQYHSRMPVLLPRKEEQAAIAAFLDRETAKIDGLISEQEKLIALLAEKRQATISQAVTRGLNPDAPMKDSGVEWLGEVPAHWGVVSAKRVSSVFVPQRNKPELNDAGEGVNWATMDDVKQARLALTSLWVSNSAMSDAGSRILGVGAVIASCVGNFGVATVNDVDVVINQQLQAYIPKAAVKAEFLRYVVVASRVYFEQVGTAATLVYVNQQGFENLPLPLPPLDEQIGIINFVDSSLRQMDTLKAEVESVIALLKERRAALIAAAVTGQIDVRTNSPEVA